MKNNTLQELSSSGSIYSKESFADSGKLLTDSPKGGRGDTTPKDLYMLATKHIKEGHIEAIGERDERSEMSNNSQLIGNSASRPGSMKVSNDMLKSKEIANSVPDNNPMNESGTSANRTTSERNPAPEQM